MNEDAFIGSFTDEELPDDFDVESGKKEESNSEF